MPVQDSFTTQKSNCCGASIIGGDYDEEMNEYFRCSACDKSYNSVQDSFIDKKIYEFKESNITFGQYEFEVADFLRQSLQEQQDLILRCLLDINFNCTEDFRDGYETCIKCFLSNLKDKRIIE